MSSRKRFQLFLLSLCLSAGCANCASSPSSTDVEDADAAIETQNRNLAWARDNREVVLGMDRGDVEGIWGEPRNREVAGFGSEGHEKWTYWNGVSTKYGIRSGRVIYFESGKVAGWETF